MEIRELKKIVNEIPESQDSLQVTVYGQGVLGYADDVEQAYVGKTYTKRHGCVNSLQIQFHPTNVKKQSDIHYVINRILKSIKGEDYYAKMWEPVPELNTVEEALDYLHKALCDGMTIEEWNKKYE